MTVLYLVLLAVGSGSAAALLQFALGSPKTGAVVPGRLLSRFGAWACMKYDRFEDETERRRIRIHNEEERMVYDRANPWKLIVCPYCNAPHIYTLALVVFVALTGASWGWILTLPLGWGVTYGTLVLIGKSGG